MVTVGIWLGSFLAASFIFQLVAQPILRRRQWAEFGGKVRELDLIARERGWTIIAASFRPGWLIGSGRASWMRGEERWSTGVRVTGTKMPW
jgi:hypothetical protein